MTTLPKFDATAFQPGTPIDNPYFPLTPGTIYRYEGEPADEEAGDQSEETIRFAVTYETKGVAGVTTKIVRETAWADGFLQEDTDDWFAQDVDGNVWYLGESTTSFEYDEEGNFIGTNNNGAWEAGVNGAVPGYIMPANPQVGDNYYQEFAPNNAALDQAKVISRNKTLATELGILSNGLQSLEFTELTPGASDYKYHAPGVGLVLVEELDANLKPEFVVELESITSATPESFTSGRGTQTDDVIDGNEQSNMLKGLRGSDLLQGLGGNDFLIGGDSNDFLIGGDGIDSLKGGNGQDILIGGAGADFLKGGKSRDQFVFRTLGDKGDLIQDFSRQDVIILVEIFNSGNYGSANPFNDYLQIQQMGSRAVVRIDPDGDTGSKAFETLVTLQNTNVSSLTAARFVV
jgi:Ca2+-binding RTX toxin-like protein